MILTLANHTFPSQFQYFLLEGQVLHLFLEQVAMRTFPTLVAGSLLALTPVQLAAQEMDMALMMKWGDARVVAYVITGVYDAESAIAYNERSGQVAHVTDRVEIELTWSFRENVIVGEAKVTNFPSETGNLRNEVANCPPPALKGSYEHFELIELIATGMERLDLTGTRSYPEVDLTDCEGAAEKRTVGAAVDSAVVYLIIANPMVMAIAGMPLAGNAKVTVAPDKKSFVIKENGWTWTYVPTLAS